MPSPFRFKVDNCWVNAHAQFEWGACEQDFEQQVEDTVTSTKKMITDSASKITGYLSSVFDDVYENIACTLSRDNSKYI